MIQSYRLGCEHAIFLSPWWMARSAVAGLYWNCLFNFRRSCQLFSRVTLPRGSPTSDMWIIPSLSLWQHLVLPGHSISFSLSLSFSFPFLLRIMVERQILSGGNRVPGTCSHPRSGVAGLGARNVVSSLLVVVLKHVERSSLVSASFFFCSVLEFGLYHLCQSLVLPHLHQVGPQEESRTAFLPRLRRLEKRHHQSLGNSSSIVPLFPFCRVSPESL